MMDHVSDARLQDLLDDRLPAADRAQAETHLGDCGACADRWTALLELRERAARAPRSLEPPADWWPGIRATIERRKIIPMGAGGPAVRRPWWSRPAVALVAAAALVLLTVALTLLAIRPEGDVGSDLGNATAQVTSYEETVGTLLEEFEAQRRKLPPAAQAEVARNLSIVDSAIQEIRAILDHDPGNAALLGVLLASYRQKVALLEHVNQATS